MTTASQIADYVLEKIAQEFDAYGNVIPPSAPFLPMGLGATLGGAAAHLHPNETARKLRELAAEVPKDIPEAYGYWREGGKATKFVAPSDVVKRWYLNKALRANALRVLGGIGAGALTGYTLHEILGG